MSEMKVQNIELIKIPVGHTADYLFSAGPGIHVSGCTFLLIKFDKNLSLYGGLIYLYRKY